MGVTGRITAWARAHVHVSVPVGGRDRPTGDERAPLWLDSPMARVLVIEDDADLRVLLGRALERADHEACLVSTGRAGLDRARASRPDVILLGLPLPDLAPELLSRALAGDLRTRTVPFLILSSRAAEVDRIAGLELGADDYVVKPFSVRELLLRVGVALRRVARQSDPPPAGVVERPPLTLDPIDRKAYVDGRVLALTPIEFRLLLALAGDAGTVHSRSHLLTDVWGVAPSLETRTIDVHVKRLREKLEHAGPMIETVRGVGYRMRPLPGATWSAPSS